MENQRLMHILLRDAEELEQLALGMRGGKAYDPLDVEFLATRITGIRQLLAVAAGRQEAGAVRRTERHAVTARPADSPEAIPIRIPFGEEEAPLPVEIAEPAAPEPPTLPSPPPPPPRPGETTLPEGEAAAPAATALTEAPGPPNLSGPVSLELEEVPVPQEKQILGEKFVAGKSLNDLLLEKTSGDKKPYEMAVTSLAGAIRTNDRYLFCRELFDGNMEELNETIARLDAMPTIQEAASFLRDHYKWKKSETSLRFIELVRRRFQ